LPALRRRAAVPACERADEQDHADEQQRRLWTTAKAVFFRSNFSV
jgi:hypothetical protein